MTVALFPCNIIPVFSGGALKRYPWIDFGITSPATLHCPIGLDSQGFIAMHRLMVISGVSSNSRKK
jgi:hypothetical protein